MSSLDSNNPESEAETSWCLGFRVPHPHPLSLTLGLGLWVQQMGLDRKENRPELGSFVQDASERTSSRTASGAPMVFGNVQIVFWVTLCAF